MTKYFARLDEFNTVIKITTVRDEDAPDEATGIAYLKTTTGTDSWKQGDKTGTIRKNGVGIGYTYNADLDAFIPIKPYASWVLDETLYQWKAPVAKPASHINSIPALSVDDWNEDTLSWVIPD